MTEAVVELSPEKYISVEDIPDVAAERQVVREEAWQTIRFRKRQLADGEEDLVPLAIDALSTADVVLETRAEGGITNPDYLERLAGLELDCLRLVAEWYRKKKPEYFPQSRHFFDAETGDFYSHGLSVRQMTENALRPINNDPEEVGRRVNERVENETPQIIQKIGGFALGAVGIRTISECTDKAIHDYQHDMANGLPHGGYGGYVPEIEKVMIRDIRFDPETGDRLEEQIGLNGIIMQHYIIQEALRRRGVETRHMDKTELHGNQLLVNDDLIDFVELLDEVASEEWSQPIFMSEPVDAGHQRDYSKIRKESMKRQESLKDMAAKTAVFILDLAEDGFDRHKAPKHVEEFVKLLLLESAKGNTELAVQMFDEKTAYGLLRVGEYEKRGMYNEAQELFRSVMAEAPGGGYCSGGSCGLESMNLESDEGRALKKSLKAENGDTVLRDKVRACKCGQKSIVYAYNATKVNKYCTSCHSFESKRTK